MRLFASWSVRRWHPRLQTAVRTENRTLRAILALKVVDPAAGSGHFLVEACRYLGDALYVACRRCDELAAAAEERQQRKSPDDREPPAGAGCGTACARGDLPDPDGLLMAYLPSRASEGGTSGVSQSRALAICRRMVAVHCLYGVDSNRLAVELAKLSLWLESYAEGLPLTFLDHRLVHGDLISGHSSRRWRRCLWVVRRWTRCWRRM